jgi:TM2 domain-containing membrane protein YozV
MTTSKADLFIMNNGRYFEAAQLPAIRDRLLSLDDDKWTVIQMLQFKDPNTSIIVSVIVGYLGIDRFLIGDTGLGLFKLLTCGGFGVWYIVDYFLIMDATRAKNIELLQRYLY